MLTEAQWQEVVLGLAIDGGWRVYHPFDSRRSVAGWPDVTLVRNGVLIFAELKAEDGKVTQAQTEWLSDLSLCIGVSAYVWRPSDVSMVRGRLAA